MVLDVVVEIFGLNWRILEFILPLLLLPWELLLKLLPGILLLQVNFKGFSFFFPDILLLELFFLKVAARAWWLSCMETRERRSKALE